MTVKYENIGASPVTITEAGSAREDHFIIENTGNQELRISFGGGDGYHRLPPKGIIIRAGVNGSVTAKTPEGSFNGELTVSGA